MSRTLPFGAATSRGPRRLAESAQAEPAGEAAVELAADVFAEAVERGRDQVRVGADMDHGAHAGIEHVQNLRPELLWVVDPLVQLVAGGFAGIKGLAGYSGDDGQ